MTQSRPAIRVGIGGWTFAPWRGVFYPSGLAQKRELEYASRQLGSIEINGTYYGTQSRESFARWRDETPDGFVFAVKGPRFATNRKAIDTAGDSVTRFLESGVTELGRKLGPINWQFPTSRAYDPASFASFLDLLPAAADGVALRHAVEVRHPSFATPDFAALARARGVGIVLAADGAFPRIPAFTAPFVYLRIMGTREEEELGYDAASLSEWAGRARALAGGEMPDAIDGEGTGVPRDVFLYVISGCKPRNPAAARAIIERL